MLKGKSLLLALALVMLPALMLAQDEPTARRMAPVPSHNGHSTGLGNGGGPSTPPAPPVLAFPPPGAKGNSVRPELGVELVPDAMLYNFVVYYEDGTAIAAQTETELPSWTVSGVSPALTWGTYSWTCRVFDGTSWSAFAAPRWSFTVCKDEPPTDPVLEPIPVEPPPGTKGPGLRPEFVVQAPVGSALLHYQVMRGDATEVVAEAFTTESRWRLTTIVPELAPGVYNWSCRAYYSGEWSNWFQPFWYFEIEKSDPALAGTQDGTRSIDPTIQPRAWPNPFPDESRIRATLPAAGRVNMTVYRADGRPVRTLVNSRVNAGDCSVTWDGRDDFGHTVGAGTYLCRICTDAFTSTVKVTKSR